ncbi:hypothetical protein M0657_007419 [Pyricularia oryzae]|nr:hypothetical protein M0657_007419 [Pyricularia oryzae]KAI7919968.1 hypothetical protein M9X92_006128 [Pyricularia oryzae]
MTAALEDPFKTTGIRFIQGYVEKILPEDKHLLVGATDGTSSSESYDRLIVAAGSQLAHPDIPGPKEHSFAVTAWRRRPRRPRRSSLALSPRPFIKEALQVLRVETRLGSEAVAVEADGVILGSGEKIQATTVVWTAGVRATSLTDQIQVKQDGLGRLTVDESLQVADITGVYAAGDAAHAKVDTDGHPVIMSCQHAMPLGRVAGYNAAASLLGLNPTPYSQPLYATCLALGSYGSLISWGWDRQVMLAGPKVKPLKQYINRVLIYPPGANETEAFAAADPVVAQWSIVAPQRGKESQPSVGRPPMLPCSVRRVVSAAPQTPIMGSVGAVAATAGAIASAARATRHQRRYSSSNPSSPDNDPKGVPPSSSDRSMAAQTSKSSSSSSGGDKRRRRAKESTDRSSFKSLPSVPSTQHLPRESLALSAFFSLHRPMSITHSLPRTVTDDAFASIFLRRGRSEKTQDVISTLSNTVHELEKPMGNLGLSHGDADPNEGVREITLKNADGSDSGVCVQLNDMLGSKFQPFCPPPLPKPAATEGSSTATETAEASETSQVEPQRRLYKAVLTIEETVDENGEVKYVAHSSDLLEDSAQPRSFLGRMAARQLRFDDSQRQRQQDGMWAISVKRQRKLKMKKKKYKKLMKKTRNERRRLHRT